MKLRSREVDVGECGYRWEVRRSAVDALHLQSSIVRLRRLLSRVRRRGCPATRVLRAGAGVSVRPVLLQQSDVGGRRSRSRRGRRRAEDIVGGGRVQGVVLAPRSGTAAGANRIRRCDLAPFGVVGFELVVLLVLSLSGAVELSAGHILEIRKTSQKNEVSIKSSSMFKRSKRVSRG
jgi:hypothetical protein